MTDFEKPKVVVSRCLEFDKVRYNGDVIPNEVIRQLEPYVEFIKVCPEVEIGLGVPRETIRIVMEDDKRKLIQPSTDRDITEDMNQFSKQFLDQLPEVDGFILKNRSPSCGITDAKYYSGTKKDSQVVKKDAGLFSSHVVEQYRNLAIEDEGRLQNFIIREHFYTKLFLLANFRVIKQQRSMKELVKFQTNNKYLFMAYDQTLLKKMGNVVANHQKKDITQVLADYEELLGQLLHKAPKTTSHINVCEHIMGYFSKELTSEEKHYFLEMLAKYREKKLPILSVTSVLKSWVVRFKQNYLEGQTYFNPYPEELMVITDSGKGRNYS